MRERPILFNGPMVRAILDGCKTQTRRIAKDVRHPDLGNIYTPGALVLEHEPQHVIERSCPYGRPGDRLWVRETFRDARGALAGRVLYRASGDVACGWQPSIHMPRWASRILLEIVSVRVERLDDISEADAAAEGAMTWAAEQASPVRDIPGGEARLAFIELWNSVGGDWSANPWVWVVEFQRVQP